MLEIWKRTDEPETLRSARETMERQFGRWCGLVDDLLDLNRITHNRLELRQSRVELGGVIEQAVEACRPVADAAGTSFRVTPARRSRYYLNADPARLAQVFGNLLSNACKYTEPGGKISVTRGAEGNEVVVSREGHRHRHPARQARAASSTCSCRSTARWSERKAGSASA